MQIKAERLRYHRARLGLTQLEIAEKVGINEQTYQALESGRRKTARAKTIGKIRHVLNVPLDEIVSFGDEDDEPEAEVAEAL